MKQIIKAEQWIWNMNLNNSEVKQIIHGGTVNIQTWMQRIEEIWGETNYTKLNSEYWNMIVNNTKNLMWNKLFKAVQLYWNMFAKNQIFSEVKQIIHWTCFNIDCSELYNLFHLRFFLFFAFMFQYYCSSLEQWILLNAKNRRNLRWKKLYKVEHVSIFTVQPWIICFTSDFFYSLKKSEVKQIIQGWTVNHWNMNVNNRRNLRWNKLYKAEQWILKHECLEEIEVTVQPCIIWNTSKNSSILRWNKLYKAEQWILKHECKE